MYSISGLYGTVPFNLVVCKGRNILYFVNKALQAYPGNLNSSISNINIRQKLQRKN